MFFDNHSGGNSTGKTKTFLQDFQAGDDRDLNGREASGDGQKSDMRKIIYEIKH